MIVIKKDLLSSYFSIFYSVLVLDYEEKSACLLCDTLFEAKKREEYYGLSCRVPKF